MAGHEIEKGEVNVQTPTERLHDDIRKEHDKNEEWRRIEEPEKDCTDQLLECTSECAPMDSECQSECVEEYKECELPWEDEEVTTEEDKFMHMDEGELISECLQIAALLGGTCTRSETLDSSGRASKKIIIEYDIQRRDKGTSQET